jgi:hypothetical protein
LVRCAARVGRALGRGLVVSFSLMSFCWLWLW